MSNSAPQSTYQQYKMRKVTMGNKCGDVFALTVPKPIIDKYQLENTKWNISIQKNQHSMQIVFTSGQDISQLRNILDNSALKEIKLEEIKV